MPVSISLAELLDQVHDQLHEAFPESYWIVAEIASISGSRHVYMELIEKEQERIKAKCRANLWAYNATRVFTHFEMMTRESLKPGMKVLLRVSVNFHVQYGLSLTVQDIDPSFSLGEFERRKQETIMALEAEGLLEHNKAFELPPVVQRLAVVSSATAAGYQDFTHQLTQNNLGLGFSIQLFPALVQGEKAPASLLQAIDNIEKSASHFDAIVLIRGGGSVIDLSCFDDFTFNYNLAQSSLPVITGIGHERDQSVADLVAHTSQKTPTAVADFLLDRNARYWEHMLQLAERIGRMVQQNLMHQHHELEQSQKQLSAEAKWLLKNQSSWLKTATKQMAQQVKPLVLRQNEMLSQQKQSLLKLANSTIKKEQREMIHHKQMVAAHHPNHLLAKGYVLLKGHTPEKQWGHSDHIEIETMLQNLEARIQKVKKK